MIWSPRAVFGFVREARFPVEEWARAVALVLASSGGDDLYRDVAWPGPSVDRRGLFGIDVAADPSLGADDLFHPATNAKVAQALTAASDGTFGWSAVPVPLPGSEAFTAAAAAVRGGAVGHPMSSGAGVASPTFSDTRRLRDLAGISDYVRSRIRHEGRV